MLERPEWCPHQDCIHLTNFQHMTCSGRLPKPEKHDNDYNTHRFCLDTKETGHGIFDLQINKSDCWWFKMLFENTMKDAIEHYPPNGHYLEKKND